VTSEATDRPATGATAARDRLFTPGFVGVLFMAGLGFTAESILRTVVPLMVLDRGGDAVWVGIAAAGAALPSVVFRPFIGGWIDTWRHDLLLRIGAAVTSLSTLLLLLPGLLTLAVMRFVQGSGWATFSVSNHSLMAKLAPTHRRGEASGYFMAMPALATLIGPAVGVTLYVGAGEPPPLALALGLGLAAVAAAFLVRIPAQAAVERPATSAESGGRVLERSAIPSTLMVTTFMAGHSLFIVFPPVYLASIGEPIEVLALYYPIYGLVMTVSQLLVGRASDRLGRAASIRLGCSLAIVGFASAILLAGMAALVVAAIAYAMAISLVSPTLSALTIDRAPAGRLGAAMATYSLGYQLATGAFGVVWGVVIAFLGFPWPFAVAILLQVVTIALSLHFATDRPAASSDPIREGHPS
jgi:MFS family permease